MSLTQLLPQKLWKCWAIAAIGAAISAVLLCSWMMAEKASASGSILGDLIVPVADRLLRGTGALAWWIAGQLSCVVWWARSRSRVDYSGRFHVWGWAAAGFFIAAILSLTDAHHLVAQLLAWAFTGTIGSSTSVTAIWLLPASVGGLTLWATLAAEFKDNLQSRVLHSFTAVAAFLLVLGQSSLGRLGSETQQEMIGKLLLVVMQCCSLISIWLHLRHVVYVSADPPAIGSSGWLTAWRYGHGRVMSALRRRTAKPSPATLEETAIAESQQRVHVEHADGATQDLRIDDAETKLKGPTKRTRQAARK